ncbi:hypothetical protein KM043_012642 [Ampulex compressa]|nr:hypothetical protein KM043_012642 [Ampulex compressa]
MSCNVMPLKKYAEISYRVKCVAVENERVFGDVYVTQQTPELGHHDDGYHFPSVYQRRKRNLIMKTLDGPDFMKLNSKNTTRSMSVSLIPKARRNVKRSKSTSDKESISVPDDRRASLKADIVKKPKVYPAPLQQRSPPRGEVVSSLVDQLLLDIYGFPAGERGRSESDSTCSSVKPRPQHQYLQKARLLLKSENELDVLILTLREHINHTGGLLVRQLRRKDYLIAKRDKQCNVITAHLQAYSQKRTRRFIPHDKSFALQKSRRLVNIMAASSNAPFLRLISYFYTVLRRGATFVTTMSEPSQNYLVQLSITD